MTTFRRVVSLTVGGLTTLVVLFFVLLGLRYEARYRAGQADTGPDWINLLPQGLVALMVLLLAAVIWPRKRS